MKYLSFSAFFLILLVSSIMFCSCFSDGSGDGEEKGDSDFSDGDSDSDNREQVGVDGDDIEEDGDADEDFSELAEEADAEPEPELEPEAEEFGVKSVRAVDAEHVLVEYNIAVEADFAENGLVYSIVGKDGAELEIKGVSFDGDSNTVTLATAKQKLGLMYTLEITATDDSSVYLSKDFLSADRHVFWVSNFASQYYEMEELEARRAGVGEHCVVYVEDGYSVDGLNKIINEFDDNIYPIETENLIAAPDLDENGRITILFLNGGNYFGGYFSPINAISDEDAMAWWGMHSNGMEIVHINVLSGADSVPGIVAHEFQHLLYQERHGFTEEDWTYHNEGLAESAVHMVYGEIGDDINYYVFDPRNIIRKGLSMVNWTYAQFENYVLAYLFMTYLAGQLSGSTDGYIDIFNLETGSPAEMDQLIQNRLGVSFMQAHHNSLAAFWAQRDEGPYSYNGMLDMRPGLAPLVDAGTTSLNLEPFAGAVFHYNTAEISYPETVGENIRYISVNAEYEIDTEEPFRVGGGVLIAYNANWDSFRQWKKERSGPDIPAIAGERSATATHEDNVCEIKHIPAWADPPPINPNRLEEWGRWKNATERRIAVLP